MTLPKGLKSIEYQAFENCINLCMINLERNIDIHYFSFKNCPLLNKETYKIILISCVRNMYNTNDYKVLEKLDINTSDSTFMQELLFENPVFYYIANEKDREIYLDAVLDSINNIDIRTKPIECIVIETDLCNIVVCEKTNNYGLYLDNNNFYWIKNKNDIEKIKNIMKNALA